VTPIAPVAATGSAAAPSSAATTTTTTTGRPATALAKGKNRVIKGRKVPAANANKKRYRFKPGTVALYEIRAY
ncbi:hypothetical protein D6D04_10882, partial [Aureobasidium pullulans]